MLIGISGPVTCLKVTGNSAVIKIDATGEVGFHFPLGLAEIELVDNGGSGSDLFNGPPRRLPLPTARAGPGLC